MSAMDSTVWLYFDANQGQGSSHTLRFSGPGKDTRSLCESYFDSKKFKNALDFTVQPSNATLSR